MAEKNKDYSFAGGLSNINPAEVPVQDIDKYRSVTEEGIKALEERYRNPNWFKVAAGFAKPQLGGFLASLGSASEALGENVEQQRENILPVTQMKQELELSKIYANQKTLQNKIYQDWLAAGRPQDEHTINRITSLGPDTPIAKAAQRYWDDTQKRIETTQAATDLAKLNPQAEASLRGFIETSLDPTAPPELIEKRRAEYQKHLTNAKPPQIPVEQWAGMGLQAKEDAINKYSETMAKAGLSKEGEAQLNFETAQGKRLPNLGTIRDLALGVGLPDVVVKDEKGKELKINGQQQMAKLLGMFGGNKPIDAIATAVNEGRFGSMFANSKDTVIRQLFMNENSRREFEELAKLLAVQDVEMRNSATNPTNAYQEMQSRGMPSINNQQDALIGILDMMARTERKAIQAWNYIQREKPDARRIFSDDAWKKISDKYSKDYSEIAGNTPKYKKPWYYSSNYEGRQEPTSNTEPVSSTPAVPAEVVPVAPTPAATAAAPVAPAVPNTSQTSTTSPSPKETFSQRLKRLQQEQQNKGKR